MYTLADVGAGWFFLALGLGAVAVVVLFFSIVLIEALVLRGLKWGSFQLSFVDSIVINLTSAAFGVVLFVLFAFARVLSLGAAPLLLISGVLSILIEGGVLTLLKRHPLRQTWIAAVAINAASYVFLFALVVGVLKG